MPTLFVLQGPDKGRTYQTPNEPSVIGRVSAQISLTDNSASRRHAEVRPSNGSWLLVDLNSSNGTFLNGQRIVRPTKLHQGDQIKVGSSLLVFNPQKHVEPYTATAMAKDLCDVDFDLSNPSGGSSILSAIDASEESVIIQAPETADAVAAWNVVYKVAETLGTIESVDALLERITDTLFDHLVVDRLLLLRRHDELDELTPQIVRFRNPQRGRRQKIVTSKTIINHVLETKEGLLCANAMTDNRFTADSKQDSIHSLGLQSIICVPILVRGEILAIFHLDCSMSHHTYTPEQLRLVVAIGRLAGMAVENVQLLESRVITERLAAAGETVAYLSHYIRNILQGMQGGADVVELAMKKRDFDSMKSGWELMSRNLNRIFLLTLNMLTFSKDRQPRIETTQLNKIIEDVILLSQNRADEHGVMLLTELDEIPAIPIDPDGVHQVTHNIVLNAIEAVSDEGGRVIISTQYDAAGGIVTMSIGDNGPGISPDQLDKIFDPFQSSKGQGGTGLGLAAAKKIVAELDGEIVVESVVGEGTTFHVKLVASHVTLADSEKTHGPSV